MTDRSPVRIALEVWGNDYRRILDTAVAAEELGFRALYYGESPHALNLETWTVLGGIAAHTTTLRIGPVITNLLPHYRSFPLFVRQVHALAVISGGRFDLRTGTGASARWASPWWRPVGIHYPNRAERRALLEEWLTAFRHLWRTPTSGFRGEHLRFDRIDLDPRVDEPPVTVAAMGPKSMKIAAAHADVWEASYLDPSDYRAKVRRFEELTREQDRHVARALEVDVVTAATRTDRRRLERSFLAERGPDGPAALGKALTGPPGELAEQLAAYVEAGVDQFLAACVDPHDTTTLETLAQASALLGRR